MRVLCSWPPVRLPGRLAPGEGVSRMRYRTIRELLATVVTVAVLVPFVGYSVRGSMPFVEDPRGMAGVGLLGVLVVGAAFGIEAFQQPGSGPVLTALAAVTSVFGLAALIAETSWALLVPMIIGLVALWLVGVAGDAVAVAAHRHG